ncbi:TetR/AcrR family transcriptional regulator [Parapedobacter sp. 10938]|uniref:TetR/AcrR family transcriptional regulator n=1 Tax=Parapedobacter flavus TaxID=3110225 RepID=UPI002DBFE64E|nr:TetR/AcrR family transcriptional regulator [Parapedobacter sp. 10938]MEC3881738.1 TetR/AcrR family transcriptional regulator [Parapedobacter sp. 10938]
MGISERKQRQHEEVRATILEQSWQIVEEEGWEALSIRKIADAIEYSTPVVYKHFENKDAILEAFSREGYARLAAILTAAKASRTSPAEQLEAISEAYWQFAQEHPKHYQIMYGLGIPTCQMVRDIPEIRQVSELLHAAINEAIASGKNPDVDSHLKATTFWSILHGLVAMTIIAAHGGPEMARRTLDDAVQGFIKALLN